MEPAAVGVQQLVGLGQVAEAVGEPVPEAFRAKVRRRTPEEGPTFRRTGWLDIRLTEPPPPHPSSTLSKPLIPRSSPDRKRGAGGWGREEIIPDSEVLNDRLFVITMESNNICR